MRQTQLARHVPHCSLAAWIRGCAVSVGWCRSAVSCGNCTDGGFLVLLEVILEVVTGTGKCRVHRRLLFEAQGTPDFVTETAMRFLCRRLWVCTHDTPELNLDFGELKCVQSACREWSLEYRPHSHRYCYLFLRTVQNAPGFASISACAAHTTWWSTFQQVFSTSASTCRCFEMRRATGSGCLRFAGSDDVREVVACRTAAGF